MMRYLVFTAVFFIFFLIYGLFLSQFNLSIMPDEITTQNAPGFFDYRGITNVHTSLNKGSLPADMIIKEAQAADVDFIFFTDLNYFGEAPVKEGYHDRLLVFWAGAYSYLDAHLLLYGQSNQDLRVPGLGQVQMLFSEKLSNPQDLSTPDFTVLAHPMKSRENWSGEYPEGLYGIEVINLKSVWRQAWRQTRVSFFWSVFVYPFNSHLALTRLFLAPEKELELWNRLHQKRKTTGFVGNETTARTLPIGKNWLRFPSYQTSFEIASNHLLLQSELTGNTATDRKKVLQALQSGQFYMSLDILADPKGFAIYIEDPRGKKWSMGENLAFEKGLRLKVHLPEKPKVPFEVVFFRDGKSFANSHEKDSTLEISQPGTYRAVVRVIPTFPLPDGKKWIPWIYTNPFYVSSSKASAASSRQGISTASAE